MGSQARGRMPDFKPQGGGPQQPEVEKWVWAIYKALRAGGWVLRKDIHSVGLPRLLEANTKIREVCPFSVPDLTHK